MTDDTLTDLHNRYDGPVPKEELGALRHGSHAAAELRRAEKRLRSASNEVRHWHDALRRWFDKLQNGKCSHMPEDWISGRTDVLYENRDDALARRRPLLRAYISLIGKQTELKNKDAAE